MRHYTSQILNVLDKDASQVDVQRLSYTYDEVGSRKSMAGLSGAPTSWTYDAKDRLTQALQSGGGGFEYDYVYASRDNMSVNGETSPVTTFTFDAASGIVTSIQGSLITVFVTRPSWRQAAHTQQPWFTTQKTASGSIEKLIKKRTLFQFRSQLTLTMATG